MSDTVEMLPDVKCVMCGGEFRIFQNGYFTELECQKCGNRKKFTTKDFNNLLKIKKESEDREKEREKHYER